MKHIFLLAFILIPVSYGFTISHGDKHNTKTDIRTYEGDLHIGTNQENDGGLYFIKNEETGVKAKYIKSEIPNEEDAVVHSSLTLKDQGKNYKYEYSTSKKQTRQEEGTHVKDTDGSEILEVKGIYSYVDPKGGYYIQGYTADKIGFRTKVSFGRTIRVSFSGIKSMVVHSPGKGIDGALLCSLAGGGCKK